MSVRSKPIWPRSAAPALVLIRGNVPYVVAIAQGSSELTIAVVVRRDGLEKAVKAVHAECGLGMRPPVPVFPFGGFARTPEPLIFCATDARKSCCRSMR